MRDPWFGHRDHITFEPVGDRTEKTAWDYSLLSVLQLIEDSQDSSTGLPSWVVDSERVEIIAEKRIDKFEASIARRTGAKTYKASPGERFSPRVNLRAGDYPTYREYLESLREKVDSEEGGTMD